MALFVVQLSERHEEARALSAEEAYRWLDEHAKSGESYVLGAIDDRTGETTTILEGIHQRT